MRFFFVIPVLLFGVLVGRLLSFREASIPPTTLRYDQRPSRAVVRIAGAEQGKIVGTIQGDVRVLLGETVVVPNASGAFRVPAQGIITAVTTVPVPAGMHFVASRRGKKYYPVTSRSGQNLSPANRVYFRDAQAAEKAGFVRGQ